MRTDDGYRKRLRRYDEPGDFRELTFSCYRSLPLLTNDLWRSMLSESIDRAAARHGFHLAAFVYMPEHVHLLVYPVKETAKVEGLLKAIKQPFSNRVKRLLLESEYALVKKLTVRERPGKTVFRFWQEGGGYDRNLRTPKVVLASVDYIHQNPVRRGLVRQATDWRWSSCRAYSEEEPTVDQALPKVHGLPPEFWNDLPEA